ncbi:MAG: endonuclease/exonuclease/phosphatase family protein [Anaerolineaceae bacterium]|nr:endonuclease/exonuclease/phosphatase family protein [Anaerolineaceae bacterium]
MNKFKMEYLWRLALISFTVMIGLQVIRAFVTLLVYNFGEDYGLMTGIGPALVVFLTPFLVPLLVRLLNPGQTLLLTVGGLTFFRVVLQISRAAGVNLVLAGIGTAFALMALPLAIGWMRRVDPASGYRMALGVMLGLTLDTGLHSAFLTWDTVWQTGAAPMVITLITAAVVFISLRMLRKDRADYPMEAGFRTLLPLALIGPFFMLQMIFLQNVAFNASATGFSMAGASALVLIGDALGILIIVILGRRVMPLSFRLLDAALLVVAGVLLGSLSGAGLAVVLVLTQVIAAAMLLRVTSTGEAVTTETPIYKVDRVAVVFGLGSLLFVLLAVLFYVSQLVTLPIPNTALPVVAALLLALAAFVNRSLAKEGVGRDWWTVAVPVVLLVIPLAIHLTQPVFTTTSLDGATFRLLDYNIHQAIDVDGWVDPEGTAQVIEAQGADIIVLQEVTRGWLISGGLDVGEWLARRLEMPYYYAPAADNQFGNVILSRIPVTDWGYTALPLGDVPMARSFIYADFDLGDAGTVTIIGTHLSAFAEAKDRVPQVEQLLARWDGAPRTIIAGDMNAHPEDDDTQMFVDAGLTSAQDVTGNSELLTFISFDPYERIDYIYGSEGITFSDFEIPQTTASDHLPLVVTVNVGDGG